MTSVVEHFSGATLPAPWSAMTAATGTISMTDHGVQGALAANGDGAAIYRSFDHTRDAIYWFCAAGRYTGADLTPWPAMRLMHSATAPVCGARSTFNILAQHIYYKPGSVTYDRINYSINPSGTNNQWQESTQSFVTGGSVISVPAEAADGDYRLYGMQWDATNSRVRWMYGHTVSGSSENPDYGPKIQTLTDWVPFSSILNGTSTTLWLVLGWPETNFWLSAGSYHIEWFSEQYGPAVHAYCNGKATIGGNYNITHHTGHDLRAPYLVPGTRGAIAIDKSASGWDSNKTQWGSAIHAQDGKYVQSYNGDAGSTSLQIGIATATDPYGPWTKDAGNPVIATGVAGSDYEQYMRFNVLVEDWSTSNTARRYKMIVNMTDAGSVTRTGVFYAANYNGPYTYDGRLLEDDATETGIAFRGQPIWYQGQWYLFYNATVGGVNTVRYAYGPSLSAGALTKANVTLSTEGVGAVEVTLTAVSGRVWTCASTTGLVKDMLLICTKTSSGDTYDVTRVRKVISSTQFEVYHTAAGAASGTVCRSANYGTDNALNHVALIDGVWYWFMTIFKAFTSHASYSAHHEANGVFVGGATPFDAFAIDWMATLLAPMGRDAWNTTISNENIRILSEPQRMTLGNMAATFGMLSGSLTGRVQAKGTMAQTFPMLSGGLTGTVASSGVTGAIAAAFGMLTGALTGRVQVKGAIAAAFGSLVAALTGRVQAKGTITQTFPMLTGSLTAREQVKGTIAAAWGMLAIALTGTGAVVRTGSIGATFGMLTGALSGVSQIKGTIGATLGSLVASLTGRVQAKGTVAQTVPMLTGGMTGTVVPIGGRTGAIAATFGMLSVALQGAVHLTGTMGGVLPSLTGQLLSFRLASVLQIFPVKVQTRIAMSRMRQTPL